MKGNMGLLDGVGFVWMALKRRARHLLTELKYDLTFEQVVTLMSLTHNEGLKVSELAELTDRDTTTTSRMIGGLEKKDLVARIPNRQDARQKLIYLTPTARERIEEICGLADRVTEEFLEGLTEEEINKTANVLHRIACRMLGENCRSELDANT